MPKLLQIGELAKQTGLSIRTLRYYDEIGLLMPSHRTEAEYRLYSEADIARLQQILSLRQLGFALKEIRQCLENPDFSLGNVINLHLARLQEQMAVSQSLFSKLSTLAQKLQNSESVAVEDLMQIIENLTMTQQYLTQEQHDLLEARLNQGQAEWLDFVEQAKSHITQGRDLNDPEVRQMAWQWRSDIRSFVADDLQLYEALIQLYQQEGAEAASWGTLDAPTLEYILKAVALLSVREEMVGFSWDRLTPETSEVMRRGQEAMRELHLNFFGTEGLILGLLTVETTPAAQALKNQHVDLVIAQNLIDDWLAKCTVSATDIPAEIPFTPRTYRVLQLTAEEANQQGNKQITPQHLLLGILQEGETTGGGLAMQVLRECKVDCDLLRQQLNSV
ncbi:MULTISPECIES: MerR family transcriptional regulator [Crocosphaera]|nr:MULTISPECIES: MerR family transcriptional regulator [Crocosphaera]EHJ10459.1 regulatory protein, MerR [Crocosphaera watsonii WH 0003]MCH2247381.1 MerR family transcriptional regulator [Crocosphaera sp.]CCQ57595.1 regulatory protein, MerR [Crocosphaera watsonii WH 0005]CCQ69304.1 regulatory protein, MerR [Crocosphaera watsonii WH 0402]